MRSPAAAIAWEFLRKNRWGWMVLGAYFVALAITKLVIGQRYMYRSPETFALSVVVPITATLIYFVGVFTFGLSGDIAAPQSMFPSRMFTLPMTTNALAAWPMIDGSAAIAVLWLATRLLAVWPAGAHVAVIWPALLAASLLAWSQALTWMPYPLRGMRVIMTVIWLASIDAIVMMALEYRASEWLMLAILAPHPPLAYLTARYAVGRARTSSGEAAVPGCLDSRGRLSLHSRFRSAAHAQLWFEWRRYGRSLPAMVALVLPFDLALLFIFRETPAIIFETLSGALLAPAVMAAFVAGTVGSEVSPFNITRPLSTASLIAAKLKATISSTLATWALVIVAVPIAVRLSGTAPVVAGWQQQMLEIFGAPRAITLASIVLVALIVLTWKQLVQSLFIGMSGREWIVKASVFATLSAYTVILPLAHWLISMKKLMAVLWNGFPAFAAVLVLLKLVGASWNAIRLSASDLLRDRTLIVGAALWTAAVFALYALLAWTFPDLILRHYVLAFVAILVVPLTRVSAVPLALAWSRHR